MRTLTLGLLVALSGCAQSYSIDGTDPVDPVDPTDPTDPVDPTDPGHLTPPPISGGHMELVDGGAFAVIADPDRDRLHIADLRRDTIRTILLEPGDEPGRIVEDTAGRVHVALRRGGAVVSLDADTFAIARRRAVCPNPRGIAHDPATDEVLVACAGGSLARMGAAGGPASLTFIDHDLRDVVVSGDRTYVTTFRSAELIRVDADGIVDRRAPAVDRHMMFQPEGEFEGTFLPNVAWRTLPDGAGGAWMLHQASMEETVNVSMEGYSLTDLECETGLIPVSLTHFPADGAPVSRRFKSTGLAVDLAINDRGFFVAMPSQITDPGETVRDTPIVPEPGSLFIPLSEWESGSESCLRSAQREFVGAEVTAVAMDGAQLIGWDRLRAELRRTGSDGDIRALGQPTVDDPGHELFHVGTFAMMACATCHPEGREDGHTWDFSEVVRRTQTLTGGILGTEPFHWSGDQMDMRAIMDETFTRRMSAPLLDDEGITQVGTWLDTLPEVAAPARDPEAAERGEAAFGTEGCVDCHAGPRFTDNRSVDVGTGGAFQVPSLLGLAVRGPWMHDGCATSIGEALEGCGGAPHGGVSDPSVRADLVAFLETL